MGRLRNIGNRLRAGGGAREKITTQDLTNAAWTSGGAFGNYAGSTSTANTITGAGINGSRSFRFAVVVGQSVTASALVTYVSGTGGGLRMSFGTSGGVIIGTDIVGNTVTSGSGISMVSGVAPPTVAFCEVSVTAFGAAGTQATFTSISAI